MDGRNKEGTGAQARAIGLVDQMGGVAAAIDLAASMGRVPVGRDDLPPLIVLPRPRAALIERLTGVASDRENDGLGPLVRTGLARAGAMSAVRLLAPFLAGNGSGIEARIPYDIEINADPYPVFHRLREEAPLYRNDAHDFYALSRFDDVERALVDRETYISSRGAILELIKADIAKWDPIVRSLNLKTE